MEDTEFCLNALSEGKQLVTILRDNVEHEEHESTGQGRWPTLRNTMKLSLRYPRYSPRLLSAVLHQ